MRFLKIFILLVSFNIQSQNNGDPINTFGQVGGFNNTVFTVKINEDNSCYVGGDFTQYKGENTTGRVVKLNPSGDIDHSFNTSDIQDNSRPYVELPIFSYFQKRKKNKD